MCFANSIKFQICLHVLIFSGGPGGCWVAWVFIRNHTPSHLLLWCREMHLLGLAVAAPGVPVEFGTRGPVAGTKTFPGILPGLFCKVMDVLERVCECAGVNCC